MNMGSVPSLTLIAGVCVQHSGEAHLRPIPYYYSQLRLHIFVCIECSQIFGGGARWESLRRSFRSHSRPGDGEVKEEREGRGKTDQK